MKTVFLAIATHLIFGALCVFVMDQFRDTTSLKQLEIIEKQKEKLEQEVRVSEDKISHINLLLSYSRQTVDSLEAVAVNIRRQSEKEQVVIDSLIADDSTHAVQQYRIALQNLGVIPDMSERLTFREIGFGAKFLSGYVGLQLQVQIKDQKHRSLQEAFDMQKLITDECENIVRTKEELMMWSDEEAKLYKASYEEATRFMANRIIVYLGFGGSYSADNILRPSIQLGLGIRIWGNK